MLFCYFFGQYCHIGSQYDRGFDLKAFKKSILIATYAAYCPYTTNSAPKPQCFAPVFPLLDGREMGGKQIQYDHKGVMILLWLKHLLFPFLASMRPVSQDALLVQHLLFCSIRRPGMFPRFSVMYVLPFLLAGSFQLLLVSCYFLG